VRANLQCPKCQHQFSPFDVHQTRDCPSCGSRLKIGGLGQIVAVNVAIALFGVTPLGLFAASGHAVGWAIFFAGMVGLGYLEWLAIAKFTTVQLSTAEA
jgi:hypothetical protein